MKLHVFGIVLLFLLAVGCTSIPLFSPVASSSDSSTTPDSTTVQSSTQPFPAPLKQPNPKAPIKVTALITHPVSILGKAGFSPPEMSMSVGDSITWANNDPSQKKLVLIVQKQGTREFMTAGQIPPGGEETLVFDLPGTYIYWTVAYGVKGKLVVE